MKRSTLFFEELGKKAGGLFPQLLKKYDGV
jgi:hypothetical protein